LLANARMKATELLQKQHREVEKLFKKIDKSDDPKEQRTLFLELATKLVGHDAIERELFYPAAESALGKTDMLSESLVEHGLVEFSLFVADEARMKKGFKHRVTVLAEVVQHHVDEEEEELLPKVNDALSAEENETLGAQMEEMFAVATAKSFRAPLHENLQQVLQGAMKTRPQANGTAAGTAVPAKRTHPPHPKA
jgi:hemerythrin superfamily protein